MPVVSRKPDTIIPNKVPAIEPESFKSVVVDSKVTPLSSLITYVEGSPWTVDYYSQVLASGNDLKDLDLEITPIQQQYTKINELILKVDNALNQSQDTESTKFTVTGSAYMYPCIIPNTADVIVASAGSGRYGVYRVTNVERKSINKESVYYIEYELMFFTDKDVERFKNLEDKVIRSFYFSKDRLVQGLSATITNEEHYLTKDIEAKYTSLITEYFRRFFDKTDSTLILPGQQFHIYDHFVVEYMLSIVDTFSASEVKKTRLLAVEEMIGFTQPQFWSAMKHRDYSELTHCNRVMGTMSVGEFSFNPRANTPRYTNLHYVVYPTMVDQSIESKPSRDMSAAYNNWIQEADSPTGSIGDILNNNYITTSRAYPIIKNTLVDECYVLSKDFYDGTTKLSLLEELTMKYLKRESIEIEKLHSLISACGSWGQLEAFYYYPIIITLIKATIPGVSSWL